MGTRSRKRTKGKPAPRAAHSGRPPGPVVATFETLHAACREEIGVQVQMGPRQFIVPVRRLLAHENEKILTILNRVHPPQKQDDQGKPVFDHGDDDYQKNLAAAQIEARAYALWLCCDLIREGARRKHPDRAPESISRAELVELVQESFTESVLEQLYLVARSLFEEGKLSEQLNF